MTSKKKLRSLLGGTLFMVLMLSVHPTTVSASAVGSSTVMDQSVETEDQQSGIQSETQTQASQDSGAAVRASQNGWVKAGDSGWYFYENGQLKTGWLYRNGNWYWLDPDRNGRMAENSWFTYDNNFYYAKGDGAIYKNGSIEKPETISCVPLVFSLTPLLPNDSVILTYLCKVRNNIPLSVQNINSSVEVTGYTNNSTITNVASVIINRAKTAELKIVKSASATSVVSGEIFSYYLTIENEGLVDAEISKINDGLESGFKVLSVRIKSGDNKAVELKTGDYLIDGGNNILIEAKNGIEKIIVPARVGDTASKTIITITGYFEK